MRRIGIRIANAALFALICFQAAGLANEIAGDLLNPLPVYEAATGVAETVAAREWEDRKDILERNLFGAQIFPEPLVSAEPEVVEEKVQETKLPLVLEATIAGSTEPRASIRDSRKRSSAVVAVGDTLENHEGVVVATIERGRVVLLNNGRREELLLADGKSGRTTVAATLAARSSSNSRRTDGSAGRRPSRRDYYGARGRSGSQRNPPLGTPQNRLTVAQQNDSLGEIAKNVESGAISLAEMAKQLQELPMLGIGLPRGQRADSPFKKLKPSSACKGSPEVCARIADLGIRVSNGLSTPGEVAEELNELD